MFLNCFRAPCHELIHCLQNVAGQQMTGQLAEHDGYFACNILARAVSEAALPQDTSHQLAYPGLEDEIQLNNLYSMKWRLSNPPESVGPWMTFETTYSAWRDSFGAGVGLWNDNNFGPPPDIKSTPRSLTGSAEFVAGPMVTTEAGCLVLSCCHSPSEADILEPTAQSLNGVLRGSDLLELIKAMLDTMFEQRYALTHPDATVDTKTGHKLLDCVGREVSIHSSVRLAGITPSQRIAAALQPVGIAPTF
jgi:hypothetical protein